jgi:hypothetical protein
MSRNRKRYREKRKQKKLEERLERVNAYGNKDPVPFEAINQIIRKNKRSKGGNYDRNIIE